MSLENFLSLNILSSDPPPLKPPTRLRNCNNKSKNHCLPTRRAHIQKKNVFFPIEKYTNSVNQENEKEQQKKINRKKVLVYWMHSHASAHKTVAEAEKAFCVHSLIPIVLRRVCVFLEVNTQKNANSENIRVRFWVEIGRSIAV